VSTPALTPCYTNLSNKAPTRLTFHHDTQQSELIKDRDEDSSEAERTSYNSQYSTDLDVSSPFDRNNEIHNQEGDQLSRRNVTSHQTGTQSRHLGSRRSKRPRIEVSRISLHLTRVVNPPVSSLRAQILDRMIKRQGLLSPHRLDINQSSNCHIGHPKANYPSRWIIYIMKRVIHLQSWTWSCDQDSDDRRCGNIRKGLEIFE
jgi:hypothetical protein